MQWWDSYRAVYGTELRAEAMVLADHGWAVVPGTFPQGEVWSGCAEAPQAGPCPVLDDWALRASTDCGQIAEWWSGLPYSILLPTGLTFDVLEVPATVGRRAAAVLRGARGAGADRGDARPASGCSRSARASRCVPTSPSAAASRCTAAAAGSPRRRRPTRRAPCTGGSARRRAAGTSPTRSASRTRWPRPSRSARPSPAAGRPTASPPSRPGSAPRPRRDTHHNSTLGSPRGDAGQRGRPMTGRARRPTRIPWPTRRCTRRDRPAVRAGEDPAAVDRPRRGRRAVHRRHIPRRRPGR